MHLLCLVQSYPGANEIVLRHLPYYFKSGCDHIVGIGTDGGGCRWPLGMQHTVIGKDSYIDGDHLPRRLVRTFEYGLTLPDWDRCAVIEYDTCFFLPVPDPLPAGLVTQLTGYAAPGTECVEFYHNPWIADRATAGRIVQAGYKMLAAGNIQAGSPDTFLGRLCQLYQIPVDTRCLKYYSRNTIHPGHPWVEEARQARRDGAHVIHGIKDASVLARILE